MGENRWRDEHEWPLARTEWTLVPPTRDGALSTEPPVDEPPDAFVYDPADPVRGSIAIGSVLGDPVDLDAVARRADVLVYTTPPLDHDVEITGPVSVELWASSSAVNTDFTARLIEVFADGRVAALCQGIVRTGVTGAGTGLREAYRYEIDLWATSVLVKAGHRLRLHISSSEFPTYDLNPNTGARITHDDSGAHGAGDPARLPRRAPPVPPDPADHPPLTRKPFLRRSWSSQRPLPTQKRGPGMCNLLGHAP